MFVSIGTSGVYDRVYVMLSPTIFDVELTEQDITALTMVNET